MRYVSIHSVRCDERSTGHVPLRRRCVTLQWTLHVRTCYSRTIDSSDHIRSTVSLDCHHHCWRGSVCPTVYHRTRHKSRPALRSQCHHHRQRSGRLLMAPKNKQPKSVYFDNKRVGRYRGINALRRVNPMSKKVVEEWFNTLHKPARTRFRKSVRGSVAQRHATHQKRSRGVGKGSVGVRTEHKNRHGCW